MSATCSGAIRLINPSYVPAELLFYSDFWPLALSLKQCKQIFSSFMLSAFSFNLHFFFRWYADPARLTKTLSGKLTDGDGEAILMQHLDKIAASKRPTTMPPPKAHASSNSNSLMIGNLRMLRPIPAVMAARSSVIKYENIWQQCHYKMHSAFEPLQTTHPDPSRPNKYLHLQSVSWVDVDVRLTHENLY